MSKLPTTQVDQEPFIDRTDDVPVARPVDQAYPEFGQLDISTRKAWGLIVSVIAIALVLPEVIVGVLAATFQDALPMGFYILLTKALGSIGALVAIGLVVRRPLVRDQFGLIGMPVAPAINWSLVTTLGCLLVSMTVVATVFGVIWAWQHLNPAMQRPLVLDQIPFQNPVHILTLLALVSIHEELVFRSLLLPLLHRALGTWPAAIIMSSMMFGAIHFMWGAVNALQATAIGVVFALAFIRTRSVVPVLLAHVFFNLIVLLVGLVIADSL